MTKSQELVRTFPLNKTFEWIVFAILIGAAPLILHEQWITGPFVNALLVATFFRLGITQALILAAIPSATALAVGTLPIVLAPTIPCIILGNILFVSSLRVLQTKPLFGVLLGAIVKFIWLTISSQWILQFFLPEAILGRVATMLSWPQLATALIGGYFALGVLKLVKR
jgi:riboflavin transporter